MELLTITNILVAATCLVSYKAMQDPAFKGEQLFYPYRIARDQSFFRFISSGFIHADYMHLGFNMLALWSIGRNVEFLFKTVFPMPGTLYLLFYLSAIVVASLPDYFAHRNNPGFAALGASGATSAIMFALIFFDPWGIFLIYGILPVPGIVLGIIYLVVSTYLAKRGTDNIGHSAHFWGGVYGFVFTVILAQAFRPDLLLRFLEQMHF